MPPPHHGPSNGNGNCNENISSAPPTVDYGAPARHEKSYLLQFVQTNCNLFEQIVICSNKHIIICLNKLQFAQTNYSLFEQIVTNNFFHVSPGLRSRPTAHYIVHECLFIGAQYKKQRIKMS